MDNSHLPWLLIRKGNIFHMRTEYFYSDSSQRQLLHPGNCPWDRLLTKHCIEWNSTWICFMYNGCRDPVIKHPPDRKPMRTTGSTPAGGMITWVKQRFYHVYQHFFEDGWSLMPAQDVPSWAANSPEIRSWRTRTLASLRWSGVLRNKEPQPSRKSSGVIQEALLTY